MTSQLKVALIRKLHESLVWLDYSFDTLSMVVYTTRHWRTSGRLVQELNGCIVECIPVKKVHYTSLVFQVTSEVLWGCL